MGAIEELFANYARSGDVRALGEVFDATSPWLLKVALHMTRSEAEAEDLLQETFLAAIRRRARFDPRRSLEAWLGGILTNEARAVARRRARERRSGQHDRVDRDPGEHAADAEAGLAVRRALGDLEEPYREPLRLRLLEELTPIEIASRLERSPGAVRVQLHRGFEILRRLLPPGLALGAGALVASRGLAAVRGAVLAQAQGHAAAAAVVGIGGTLLMKKALALGIVFAACVSGWLILRGGGAEHVDAEARSSALREPVVSPPAESGSSHLPLDRVAEGGPREARPTPLDVLTLHGRVVDSQGRPIALARVTASTRLESTFMMLDLSLPAEGSGLGSLETDRDGRFTLAARRAVPVELAVRAEGFAPSVTKNCYGGQEVVITLVRGAAIAARVLRASDRGPVAGALVRLREGYDGRDLARGETGSAGSCLLADLPAGEYLLEVVPQLEEPPMPAKVELGEGESVEKAFVVLAGEVTRGTVTDAATGRPLAGAEVGVGGTFRRLVRTGADGRYEIRGYPVARGDVLFARAAGHALESKGLTKADLGRVLDFALAAGGIARGKLVDEAGRPFPGAYVAAVVSEGVFPTSRQDWRSTQSGSDGAFEFRELLAGARQALWLRAPGRATLVYDFPRPLEAGETLELGEFVLVPGGSVEGRVVDARGEPISGCGVDLIGENSDRRRLAPVADAAAPASKPGLGMSDPAGRHFVRQRQTRTGAEGRFWIGDLATGTYQLKVVARDGAERTVPDVRLVAGTTIVLADTVLDLGLRIAGTVVDEAGRPVEGVWVFGPVLPGRPARSRPQGVTRRDGAFSFDGIPAGVHELMVMALGRATPEGTPFADTVVGVEGGAEGVRVVMPVATFIEGTVVDGAGAGIAGVRVGYQVRAPRPFHHVIDAISDQKGEFRFRVPAGSRGTVSISFDIRNPGLMQRASSGPSLPRLEDVAAGARGLMLTLR